MRFLCLLALVVLAACASAPPTERPSITLISPDQLPTSVFTDPVLIDGQRQYDLMCAHCHGYEGQGQLAESIQRTLDLGMNTVPGHNRDSDTWNHPDQLLIQVIKQGIQNPLDHYPMPAFGAALTDEQINALLAYIKHWWTPEQLEHQEAVTRRWAEIDQQFADESS